MRRTLCLLLAGPWAWCIACTGGTPAKIAFTAPPALIASKTLHRLNASLVDEEGRPASGEAVTYSAVPEGVVDLSAGGELLCLRSGDVSLVLRGGGVTTEIPIKCRIPTEIAVPAELRLVLGSKPAAVQPRVMGEGGVVLKDVAAEITSSDPAVAAVENGKVRPVAVGRARLRAAVGTIAAVTPVEVVERIVSERLALADGARHEWHLKEGTWLVTIDARADPPGRGGVALAWERAACPDEADQPSHRSTCTVMNEATLTVTNPNEMGLGGTVRGTILIERVPPE